MTTSATILNSARRVIDKTIIDELRAQGHYLTGSLERSFTAEITEGNLTIIQGMALGYGQILNDGVTPARIPFSEPSGRGGTSKYIQGLFQFWRLKGLNEKEALRAAFATAKIQKREGMSTKASVRFSKNGRRQEAFDQSFRRVSKRIDQQIARDFDKAVSRVFNQTKTETI
jgi:hypothetical protein